jgi:hypothetical protein
MFELSDSLNDFGRDRNDRWRTCHYCGPVTYKAVISFDSGSVEPTADETLTGATSGSTGIVSQVILDSGSWAGGNAAGQILLTSVTGYDLEGHEIFSDNEAINGSTAGDDCATVNGVGSLVVDGLLYPESEMVFYRGTWHCAPHFKYVWRHEFIDETKINLNDKERNR